MRNLGILTLVMVAGLVGPALAGGAYEPPKLSPLKEMTAPEDLRADATELLKAVKKQDAQAIARWFTPTVTVISGAIDLAYPRLESLEGPWKDGRAMLVTLGGMTGGDWDVPPGADLGKFVGGMELEFIEASLTDGQSWGVDPMLKGAICTYAVAGYKTAEVKRTAARLGIEGSSFDAMRKATEVRDRPAADGKVIATFEPGRLYGMDYDTDTPQGWSAFHLPEGGIGFVAGMGDDFYKPYAQGLCFAKQESGDWLVVAQTSTGL